MKFARIVLSFPFVPELHYKQYEHTGSCKRNVPCLNFHPHYPLTYMAVDAQPIGPDGTSLTKLSSLSFAQLCNISFISTLGKEEA